MSSGCLGKVPIGKVPKGTGATFYQRQLGFACITRRRIRPLAPRVIAVRHPREVNSK